MISIYRKNDQIVRLVYTVSTTSIKVSSDISLSSQIDEPISVTLLAICLPCIQHNRWTKKTSIPGRKKTLSVDFGDLEPVHSVKWILSTNRREELMATRKVDSLKPNIRFAFNTCYKNDNIIEKSKSKISASEMYILTDKESRWRKILLESTLILLDWGILRPQNAKCFSSSQRYLKNWIH